MKIFINYYLTTLFICLHFTAHSQLHENFSDGELLANPSWTGNLNSFIVNPALELQLSSIGSSTGHLFTPLQLNNSDTITWEFDVQLNFSPSSQNYSRIYLVTNDTNTVANSTSFYLQLGESGSNDAITLLHVNNGVGTQVLKGLQSQIANAFDARIKVIHYPNGLWLLFADYNKSGNYIYEAGAVDSSNVFSGYFGIECTYTTSNANKFFYDNINIDKLRPDTNSPSPICCNAISNNTLSISFSEPIQDATLISDQHFSLMPANTIINISKDSTQKNYNITFQNTFVTNGVYTIYCYNIKDTIGNILYEDSLTFTYKEIIPPTSPFFVFSEIMANPTASPALPPVEYIEIYNNSNNYIKLDNTSLSDATSTIQLPTDTISPNSYAIICAQNDKTLLQTITNAQIIAVSSMPTLNNDGDHLKLTTNQTIIDEIIYTTSSYHDPIKSNGGWSLERIDKTFTCMNDNNWKASCHSSGGTPGKINSVDGNFYDETNPTIKYLGFIDSTTLELYFSEDMHPTLTLDTQNYLIENWNLHPTNILFDNANKLKIQIELPQAIQKGITYSLKIKNLTDCIGNTLEGTDYIQFTYPVAANKNNVCINEILFNPQPNCVDFLELKIADETTVYLNTISISNKNLTTGMVGTLETFYDKKILLLPGQHYVFTSDENVLKSCHKSMNEQQIIQCNLPSYNDDEGVVVIMDQMMNTIDSLHYNENMHHEFIEDVESVSLEKINTKESSNNNANWHSASSLSGFSTPTQKNSQAYNGIPANKNITLSPQTFSPDNDGYKDYSTVRIEEEEAGTMCNISVYNEWGGIIQKSDHIELLGSSNYWNWDGANQEQQIQPIGLYIISIETIKANGKIKITNLPCVISN